MKTAMECLAHDPSLMLQVIEHMEHPDQMANMKFVCRLVIMTTRDIYIIAFFFFFTHSICDISTEIRLFLLGFFGCVSLGFNLPDNKEFRFCGCYFFFAPCAGLQLLLIFSAL